MSVDQSGLAQLARWGISEADADMAGLFYTDSARSLYGDEMPARPGLVIPYFQPDGTYRMFERAGQPIPFARIRWLGADPPQRNGFKHTKPVRYTQPAHTGTAAYFWRGAQWGPILSDPQ